VRGARHDVDGAAGEAHAQAHAAPAAAAVTVTAAAAVAAVRVATPAVRVATPAVRVAGCAPLGAAFPPAARAARRRPHHDRRRAEANTNDLVAEHPHPVVIVRADAGGAGARVVARHVKLVGRKSAEVGNPPAQPREQHVADIDT